MPLTEDSGSKVLYPVRESEALPVTKRQSSRERAGAYIDSPLMTHRVHYRGQLAARIQGNYGIYYTQVCQVARGIESECSCPSDVRPCKHVRALRATWKENPESFSSFRTF